MVLIAAVVVKVDMSFVKDPKSKTKGASDISSRYQRLLLDMAGVRGWRMRETCKLQASSTQAEIARMEDVVIYSMNNYHSCLTAMPQLPLWHAYAERVREVEQSQNGDIETWVTCWLCFLLSYRLSLLSSSTSYVYSYLYCCRIFWLDLRHPKMIFSCEQHRGRE